MTIILYTTDLHGNNALFDKLFNFVKKEKPDALIIGGDLCPRGPGALTANIEFGIRYQQLFLQSLIEKVEKLKHRFKEMDIFMIMGNDDFRINMDLLKEADAKGTIKLMSKKPQTLGKYSVMGYAFVTVTPFMLKDWEKFDDTSKALAQGCVPPETGVRTKEGKEITTIEEDMEAFETLTNPAETIYVMHCPPYDTKLDMLGNKVHVGSKSIRNFIKKSQPLLTLHGHIHESYQMTGAFMDKIGNTVCINQGSNPLSEELRVVKIEAEHPEKAELILL